MIAVPQPRRGSAGGRVGERRGGPITYVGPDRRHDRRDHPALLDARGRVAHERRASPKTPPPLTPGGNLFSNIGEALDQVDMFKALLNSLVVSGAIALGTVFFCTLAGFAFAKLRFRFSTVLLIVILATMMVPAQLGVVPLFILMAESRVGEPPAGGDPARRS